MIRNDQIAVKTLLTISVLAHTTCTILQKCQDVTAVTFKLIPFGGTSINFDPSSPIIDNFNT